MKKILLILGMVTCLLGLTACGNESDAAVMTEEETAAIMNADGFISEIDGIISDGVAEQYATQYDWLAPILENWESGMEELGSLAGIGDHTVKFDGDKVIVNTEITGTELDPNGKVRTADVELTYSTKGDDSISLSVNVNYTFGELMKNAGLNTILGMGTVFAILILISLVISCFGIINKLQNTKQQNTKSDAETSVDKTISQIIESEEASDDEELVAVISAAIAAYESENGYVSADGVVIRSIRKVNKSKWQNA